MSPHTPPPSPVYTQAQQIPHEHGHKHHHHKPGNFDFEFLFLLLKQILQLEPQNESNITYVQAHFGCQQASYLVETINPLRPGKDNLKKYDTNEHNHNLAFTVDERTAICKDIVEKATQVGKAMPELSGTGHHVKKFGPKNDPSQQITYTFKDNKWHVTAGANVNAVILDPAGGIIEITPGPHIHQYGKSNDFVVKGACNGHHHPNKTLTETNQTPHEYAHMHGASAACAGGRHPH